MKSGAMYDLARKSRFGSWDQARMRRLFSYELTLQKVQSPRVLR